MVGAKIPVLEVENLFLKDDGRGLILYDDGTNFAITSTPPWASSSCMYSGESRLRTRSCFPVASSMGWLKIHYVSGSTYGATGATAYIPLFRNLDTGIA